MPSSQRDPAGRRALLALCGVAALVLGAGCEPCRAQSFKSALGQAYLYNPQLAAGRAGVRQMDEGVPRALSGWRPTVTVLGEVGKSVVSDSLARGPSTPSTGAVIRVQPRVMAASVASALRAPSSAFACCSCAASTALS